jgi:hypothetical protein
MLSTSDWIAIVAALIQVAAAVALGIWQVRQAQRKPHGAGDLKPRIGKFDWRWFFHQSWQFLFCAIVGVILIWYAVASSQPLTKGLVLELVVYSFMFVFGVIFTLIMAAVTAVRPNFVALSQSMSNLEKVFAEKQEKHDI